MYVDEWFRRNLVCPRDFGRLEFEQDSLVCAAGHSYPCLDGIPVMLIEAPDPTGNICGQTLKAAREQTVQSLAAARAPISGIDAYVRKILVGTCGNLYTPVTDNLSR